MPDLILEALTRSLEIIQGACDCGECGPCEFQTTLRAAIPARRSELRSGITSTPRGMDMRINMRELKRKARHK